MRVSHIILVVVRRVPAFTGVALATVLNIQGAGFHPDLFYICQFMFGERQTASFAFLVGYAELLCETPEWGYAAATTEFRVIANRTQLSTADKHEFES